MNVIVFSKDNKAKIAFNKLVIPDVVFTFVSFPLELETKLGLEKFDLYILFTEELRVNEFFYTGKVLGSGIPVLVVSDGLTILSYSLYVSNCEVGAFLKNAEAAIKRAHG